MLDDSDKLNIYNKDLTDDGINFVNNEIPVQPVRPPKKSSNGLVVLLIFVALAAVGYFGYAFIAPQIEPLLNKNNTQNMSAENAVMNEADSFYNQVTKDGAKEPATENSADEPLVDIDVPVAQKNNKTTEQNKNNINKLIKEEIAIPVEHNLARQNPFLPYMESPFETTGLPYELLYPPSEVTDQTQAVEMMQTTVSGIMYDKYRPSAIINVDGKDQLVHKGDKLANFVVLNITPDKVIVKTGTNIYRASVGQPIGDDVFTFNPNNTKNQFGGAYSKRPKKVLEITSY